MLTIFGELFCILFLSGRNSRVAAAAYQYSTGAAIEDPIKPSVSVEYTKLFINGQFVDSASGNFR